MNNWIFWLFILGVVFSPLIYSAGSIRNLILGWRIPITWISALPNQGWVEVVGRGKGEPIQSWLNKYECIYWHLEVKEYQSSGRGGGRWKTLHKESSGVFEVDDLTGRVKIQPGNSDFVLNNETVMENLDEVTKTRVETLGLKTKGFLGFNKRLKVYERTLSQGEEILVLGKIHKTEGQVSISSGAIIPLVISNLSRGELLKTYFWRTARQMIFPLLIGLGFTIFYLLSVFK
jgi:hypothetical protein